MKFIYYKDKNRRTDYDEGNQCSNLNLLRSCRDTCTSPVYTSMGYNVTKIFSDDETTIAFDLMDFFRGLKYKGKGYDRAEFALYCDYSEKLQKLALNGKKLSATELKMVELYKAEVLRIMDILKGDNSEGIDFKNADVLVDSEFTKQLTKGFSDFVNYLQNSRTLLSENLLDIDIDILREVIDSNADDINKAVTKDKLSTETRDLLAAFDRVLDGGLVFTFDEMDIDTMTADVMFEIEKLKPGITDFHVGLAHLEKDRWCNHYDMSVEDFKKTYGSHPNGELKETDTDAFVIGERAIIAELLYYKSTLYEIADEYAIVRIPTEWGSENPFVLLRYKNSKGQDMIYLKTYALVADKKEVDKFDANDDFCLTFEEKEDTPFDTIKRYQKEVTDDLKKGEESAHLCTLSDIALTFVASDKSTTRLDYCGENGVICPLASICAETMFKQGKFNAKRCKKCLGFVPKVIAGVVSQSIVKLCPITQGVSFNMKNVLSWLFLKMDDIRKLDFEPLPIALSTTINKTIDLDEPCLTVVNLNSDAVDWVVQDDLEIMGKFEED